MPTRVQTKRSIMINLLIVLLIIVAMYFFFPTSILPRIEAAFYNRLDTWKRNCKRTRKAKKVEVIIHKD